MKKHVNIPVFIPHLGCPNQCVFCNQKTITGRQAFEPDSIISTINEALETLSPETEAEIAFFGGSFTGIDYSLMCHLLEIAYGYVKSGKVKSIRCSTRPDYINERVLRTLKKYGVSVIELGIQSIDEGVLAASKRGHGFAEESRAVKMVVDNGFFLVGQMMIGLPAATAESEIKTARFICESGASAARVYPTVVFKDTELCLMAQNGIYSPLELEEAIERTANVLKVFFSEKVPVIRIGLCASENLSAPDTYFAGPNHSALGELVENRIFYKIIFEKISAMDVQKGSEILVKVPKGALSKAIGQNKINKFRLISEFSLKSLKFSESPLIFGYDAECEERKK